MKSKTKDYRLRSIVPLSVIVAILMFFMPFRETQIMAWYQEESIDHNMTITMDLEDLGDEFEGFGCSSCWWSQIAGGSENAEEIAKLLYSKDGLGLNIYRYNVGAGSKDNFKDTIWDRWRQTESFYVYDYETETGYYDFTRDAEAQEFLDLCLSYGCIDTVVLFANSPHYSMTKNNKTGGNDNWWESNLAEENYEAYADYFLTITEYFIDKGVPVKYISPVNEPNWSWGNSGYQSQEGTHYSSEEIYGIYRAFVNEIKERDIDVLLSGPESGEISHRTYEWFEYLYNDPEIRPYLGNLSYHSYWTDNNVQNKIGLGNWIKENTPDIPVEMSEWCELPCASSTDSINGALITARVMANDLNFTSVDSWTAWVGVNGIGTGADGKDYSDGLLAANYDMSEYYVTMRYYAIAHYSKFIPVGSRKVATEKDIFDYIYEEDAEGNVVEANYITNQVAYLTPDDKVVLVITNEGVDRKVKFKVDRDEMTVYTTTQESQLQQTYSGDKKKITIPENSITTIVFK